MDSSRANPDEGGYATPAALVLVLAVGALSAGAVARSTQELELSRIDLQRMQAEYNLDGAQLTAAAEIVRSTTKGPYQWIFGSDRGWVAALAEPEAAKLSPAAAAQLTDGNLQSFGVEDGPALRARLLAANSGTLIAGLDAAPLWRACAPSLVSYFGAAEAFSYAPPAQPGPGPTPQSWRVGEVWRVRLIAADGWRDERTVRFTGDAQHPFATIDRRFSRGPGETPPCPALLAALSAALGPTRDTP